MNIKEIATHLLVNTVEGLGSSSINSFASSVINMGEVVLGQHTDSSHTPHIDNAENQANIASKINSTTIVLGPNDLSHNAELANQMFGNVATVIENSAAKVEDEISKDKQLMNNEITKIIDGTVNIENLFTKHDFPDAEKYAGFKG